MLRIKSCNTLLSALVVLLIASSVGGLVWYVNASSYSMALDMGRQTAVQSCESTVRSLDRYLEGAEVLAKGLAKERKVRNSLMSSYGANKAYTRLKQVVESQPGYAAVAIFDATGRIVAGADTEGNSLAGTDPGGGDAIEAILGGRMSFASGNVVALEGGGQVFAVGHAITDGGDTATGGVLVFPRLDIFMTQVLEPVRVGDAGYGFILDAQGRVLGHGADPSLVLRDVSAEAFIQKALAETHGDIWYTWNGRHKLMSFKTVAETGWRVAVSVDEADLAATAVRQRSIMIAAGVAMILLVAGSIVFLVRTFALRPLAQVERFSGQVAAGDYNATLDGHFRFEFAGLAEHVTDMVAELKSRLGFSQGVLSGITQPCVVVGPDNHVRYVNDAMCAVLELPGAPSEYIGTASGELFYGDASRHTITQRALEQDRQLEEEITYSTPSGRTIVVNVTSTPFFDMDGTCLGTMTLWFDLTAIREQQQRIRNQHERISHAAGDANDVSSMVSSSAEELAAQVEQSNHGAEQQQQRTGEVAAAMEEMNATVLEVARNADNAAEMAEQVRDHAQRGEGVAAKARDVSVAVAEQSAQLTAQMEELGKQAEAVGQVITVIQEIADQTNLLALNAAIEAARAGDAGRGFAVVADEVRKLAERTMSATREVTQSVTLIQQSAAQTVDGTRDVASGIEETREMAEQSGAVLSEIVRMIDSTADQVRAIATAADQQTASSEEITRATEGIRTIATETSTAMGESTQAIQALAEQAARLQSIIGDMRSGDA
jgi:methyl-accepting chemotaxis protein